MVGVPEDPATEQASTGLVIREANEADLGRIVELLTLGAVPGAPAGAEDPDDLGAAIASALAEIDATDGAVLVAELDGEVVGVCQLIVFRHLQRAGRAVRRDRVGARAPRAQGFGRRRRAPASTPSTGPAGSVATGCSSPRTSCAATRTVSTSASASPPRTWASSCRCAERSTGRPLARCNVIM